jgi:hypothetical protein
VADGGQISSSSESSITCPHNNDIVDLLRVLDIRRWLNGSQAGNAFLKTATLSPLKAFASGLSRASGHDRCDCMGQREGEKQSEGKAQWNCNSG